MTDFFLMSCSVPQYNGNFAADCNNRHIEIQLYLTSIGCRNYEYSLYITNYPCHNCIMRQIHVLNCIRVDVFPDSPKFSQVTSVA